MAERGGRSCALSSSRPQGNAGVWLLQTLEDLSELDFKKFRDALRGMSCIPWGRLEKADCLDVKNLMVDFYGEEGALDMAIAVLEQIQLRKATTQLQESREKAWGPEPRPGSLSPGWGQQAEVLGCSTTAGPASSRPTKRPPALPDYQWDYKEAIRQAYSHIKDQNTRVGDAVSLDASYSKLVIVSKRHDKGQWEHEIVAMGRRHMEILQEQASSSITISDLFKPNRDSWTPKEVVLLGAAGMGKTMTARKIMLDWACDKIFVEFDYVFYIHCRECNLLTSKASMEDLIAQCCPDSTPPVSKMLGQPERVLFVIDGFDELRFAFDQPQMELCSQPWEQRPVEIVLSSLFRRRLLPKSSLLVTTRPTALRKLGRCLQCERYVEIVGFSEAERKEYFHRFFENVEQAAAAFQFVRGNEMLFTMCLVPIVCWIVCTVMKQQLGLHGGLAQSPKTATGIYILYLTTLLQSLKNRLRRDMPRVLHRLCCLAADGVWNQKVLFEKKEVPGCMPDQREALPLLLNEHLFLNNLSRVITYSFIHPSFQEFFAALFYLLEDNGGGRDLPVGPTRDVKELLKSYGNSRNHFMLTVRFLFGLLNEERRRELEEEMGCKITPRIKQELLAWLRNSQETALIRELEVCHCLYELQDKRLVATALKPFTGVELCQLNLSRFDQMVLSFSLKHFPGLESLDLGSCFFLWDDPKDHADLQLAEQDHWDNQDMEGKLSPIHLLCGALEESGCALKRLRFDWCQLTSTCCGALASILCTKSTLTELVLVGNPELQDSGVRLLCQGLRRGALQLQTLRLVRCNLTATGCRHLATVLGTIPSLEHLDLSDNPLGDGGVQELCEELVGPSCSVRKLWLLRCRLTEESCGALTEVLCTSPSLTELDLSDNTLRDGGMQRLSKGLQDPACQLQTLSLGECRLTGACCKDLCAVLSASRSLDYLDLSENNLGDGGVRLLCERLRHPTCSLQRLWLRKSGLNKGTLQTLAALKEVKPTLNIGFL